MQLLARQTNRDLFSLLITLFIYLLSAWLLHHYFSAVTLSSPPVNTDEISLDLSEFVKETEPVETPVVEPEEIEQEQLTIPEIPEETIERKPPEQEVIEEASIVREPVSVPITKPEKKKVIPPKKPKPVTKKTKHIKKVHKTAHSYHASVGQRGTKSHLRHNTGRRSGGNSRFLRRLKDKIDSNKVYPRIARKRGMQGRVKVHFHITSAGKVSNISVKGPRVFANSARFAVKRSFPVSTRGASLPMNVTLTLNYHLKK
jgi:protein TonB